MTKLCPFCAEEIQEAAIVCKHCKRDFAPLATPASPPPEFSFEPADAKGNLKGSYLVAVAGLGACMLWIPTRNVNGAGWLLFGGWVLVWVGMARTIRGSGIVRYGGAFLLACAVLAGVGLMVGPPSFGSSSDNRFVMPQPIGAPAPVVTQAEFEQLIDGMSYEEVVRIIGAAGELESSSDLAGIKTVMYSWMNSNGSNMNAMFQNGRLVQKAQFGLR